MANSSSKKNNNSEITIKDASSTLDISESTVKKYLKDFDLKTEKGMGSKAVISQETFQALSDISKLRANGLSIQEIKELKSQEPTKHVLDEIEEDKQDKDRDIESPNGNKENDEANVPESLTVESVELDDLTSDVESEKEDASDDVVPDDTEGNGKQPDEQGEEPRRRRGFNYRYVERQISNDSKRISSLRRRLQNPNISVQERLFYEEALERRILFLNGWKHILRWVSKQ